MLICLLTHRTLPAEMIHSFFLFQVGYIRIDGSVPSSERIQLVNKFQNDPETRVAVLSIQAAGQVVTQSESNCRSGAIKNIYIFQIALDFQIALRRCSAATM